MDHKKILRFGFRSETLSLEKLNLLACDACLGLVPGAEKGVVRLGGKGAAKRRRMKIVAE